MLERHLTALVWLLLLLQAFQPQVAHGHPVPRRKKAFGAGMLTGALAGVVVSKALSNPSQQQQHHYYHGAVPVQPTQSQPQPIPSTVVEKGELLPNGCYKQIVTEPDVLDPRKFVKSEQLICPAGVAMPGNVASVPMTVPIPQTIVPVAPAVEQPSATLRAAENVPAVNPMLPVATMTNTNIPASQSATPNIPVQNNLTTPNADVAQVAAPVAAQVTAQVTAQTPIAGAGAASSLIPGAVLGAAPTPGPPIASVPFYNKPAAPPQVVVLSKKTGFYGKSSAMMQSSNYSVIFLLATFLAFFL